MRGPELTATARARRRIGCIQFEALTGFARGR
jgi:hypothetical protein